MEIFLGFPSNPQSLSSTVLGGVPSYLGIILCLLIIYLFNKHLDSLTMHITMHMTDFDKFSFMYYYITGQVNTLLGSCIAIPSHKIR